MPAPPKKKDIRGQADEEWRELFDILDTEHRGVISIQQVQTVLDNLGLNPTTEELHSMDITPSGLVTYAEFISIVNPKSIPNNNNNIVPMDTINIHNNNYNYNNKNNNDSMECEIYRAFEAFDRDGDGFITLNELKDVMIALGQKLSDEELQRMINEADTDGDLQISLEEFLKLMA